MLETGKELQRINCDLDSGLEEVANNITEK